MSTLQALRADFKAGIIRTDDGQVLAMPGMSLAQLRELLLPQRDLRDNGGVGWYDFPNVTVGGRRCVVNVIMDTSGIDFATLYSVEPQTPPWDAQADKQKHDAWLTEVFGRDGPYRFAWGVIAAEADLKGGSGAIVFG
jgi:hypothetical protein